MSLQPFMIDIWTLTKFCSGHPGSVQLGVMGRVFELPYWSFLFRSVFLAYMELLKVSVNSGDLNS